ncbi:hypothetical protein L6164_028832 [Bauhinia variegata]|uniref:Uncharacterized protein n=1 Tax=Bauhinia variegata TaxID=167791 RepID=A0ACB9L7Q7_BAUVA|nr:hypothetical protein L6164_028832 [Bauhinia variegata]
MAAASVAFNGIVLETLRDDNYEYWSVLLKNYLTGQGLWDVVSASATESKDEDWRKKNAKALHAIQLACGSSAFARISKCVTADEAWNQLSYLFNSDLNRDIELGILDDIVRGNDNVEQLRRHVNAGKWEAAKSCIDKEPDVVFSVCSVGRTILHVAVIAGKEQIVEKLVNLVHEKEKLLKMQDIFGYTALALAAKLTDSSRMAKCMAENCKDLLTMKTIDNEIPVLLSSANGREETTRYLNSQTHWNDLSKEEIINYGALLLTRCISAKIFDVALELLQNPSIPITNESQDLRPLYALAQMPSAFRLVRYYRQYEILEHSTDGSLDHSTDESLDHSTEESLDHSTEESLDHSNEEFKWELLGCRKVYLLLLLVGLVCDIFW